MGSSKSPNNRQKHLNYMERDKKLPAHHFNNASRIIRLASNVGKRLFLWQKGMVCPKAVIKNEYGITLGKVEAASETGEKDMWSWMVKKIYVPVK